jgi:glucosylceramidase
VETTAFQNPDGSLAVVVLNRTELSLPLTLRHSGHSALGYCPPRSITTYCWPALAP